MGVKAEDSRVKAKNIRNFMVMTQRFLAFLDFSLVQLSAVVMVMESEWKTMRKTMRAHDRKRIQVQMSHKRSKKSIL